MASLIWPTEENREEGMQELEEKYLAPLRALGVQLDEIDAALADVGDVDLGALASCGELIELQVSDVYEKVKALTAKIQTLIDLELPAPAPEV